MRKFEYINLVYHILGGFTRGKIKIWRVAPAKFQRYGNQAASSGSRTSKQYSIWNTVFSTVKAAHTV